MGGRDYDGEIRSFYAFMAILLGIVVVMLFRQAGVNPLPLVCQMFAEMLAQYA